MPNPEIAIEAFIFLMMDESAFLITLSHHVGVTTLLEIVLQSLLQRLKVMPITESFYRSIK